MPHTAGVHVLFGVKITNFCSDLAIVRGCIKLSDPPNRRAAGDEGGPEIIFSDTVRGDDAETSDDNATRFHGGWVLSPFRPAARASEESSRRSVGSSKQLLAPTRGTAKAVRVTIGYQTMATLSRPLP